MRRNLVINMGGTITAYHTTRGGGVSLGDVSPLLQDVFGPEWEYREWWPILSENTDWPRLDKAYRELHHVITDRHWSTVCILHGTDTLVYTAGLFSRFMSVNCPVYFVSTQRSPDHPGWQLKVTIDIIRNPVFKKVSPAVYVVNYESPDELTLIHPPEALKHKSYARGCFKGLLGPEYVYKNGHLFQIKKARRCVKKYRGFLNQNPAVLYVHPSIELPAVLPPRVLLIPYGLGNLPDHLAAVIEKAKDTTFYLANNLEGSKNYGVYRSRIPDNVITLSVTVEYATLLLALA